MQRTDFFQGYTGCGPLPAQVVEMLPSAEEIAQSMARTVFASQWGDAIERAHTAAHYPEREESERDRAPEGFELPNLSGCDLCDCAPYDRMPGRFLAYSRHAVAHGVALAFNLRAGSEILAEWESVGAEDLGHNLAFEFMGTGAADGDAIGEAMGDILPAWDCDGRLYLSLGEIMEPADVPTDSELLLLSLPADKLAELRAELADGADFNTCAEIMGEERESIELPDGTRLHYANRGDTYSATLTYDGSSIRVESWGGRLESAEEAHTYATGETRCAYCSEWARDLDTRACPECGHGPE